MRGFGTLEEYTRATHQDQHSVAVDYDIFVNVPKLCAQYLTNIQKVYKAAAVDRGVILPNITDGFADQAPGLGRWKWLRLPRITGHDYRLSNLRRAHLKHRESQFHARK